jgi:hypothetical protein
MGSFEGRLRKLAVVLSILVAAVTLLWYTGVLRWPKPQPPEPPPAAVSNDAPASPTTIRLSDVTELTRIAFEHQHGGFGRQFIVEAMSAGMATFDYNSDGLIDIYFLNGAPLSEAKVDPPPRNALYRNEGDWKFTDVTREAGVGDTGYGLGVAVADYDNDGNLDLYLNNFGPNVLYRNNGDGTFTDVTAETDAGNGSRVGAGAAFLDIEADGDLDLYVANYVMSALDANPRRIIGGFARAPSPLDFNPETHTLYRNDGNGHFTDISLESGVGSHKGTGMGMVACDFDNDRDTDVFVCNDVAANFLFENDGQGRFEEIGMVAGAAYNFWGKANGSMGVDCADYDNDGWLDFFMTSYQAEMPCLYKNLGQGLFEDISLKSGVGVGCLTHVNWGTGFADFDNDGYRDLYVAHGHLEERIHDIDDTTAYKVANSLFQNCGDGKFIDVSEYAGDGMLVTASSRGACFDDLDNDGRWDVVVLNAQDKPTVLRNETDNGYHWLQIRLLGTERDTSGVGTRVKVVAGELSQIDEVHSGRGYQSHFGTRLHFGLGPRDRVDRIEVQWPGGGTDQLENVAVDRQVTIVEGSTRGE